MKKKFSFGVLLGLLVAGVLILVASPIVTADSGSKQFKVRITNHGYSPAKLSIHVGDTVSWNTTAGFLSDEFLANPPTVFTYSEQSSDTQTAGIPLLGQVGATYTFVTPQRIVYHMPTNNTITGTLIVLPVAQSPSTLSNPSTITNAPPAAIKDVTITGTTHLPGFDPASITIQTGDNVTWTNKDPDGVSHSVFADNNSFNSGLSTPITQDGIYSHVFTTAGTITYHCAFHPQMKGTVIVKGQSIPAGTTGTPTSTSTPTPTKPTPLPSSGGGFPSQLFAALFGFVALLGFSGAFLRRHANH